MRTLTLVEMQNSHGGLSCIAIGATLGSLGMGGVGYVIGSYSAPMIVAAPAACAAITAALTVTGALAGFCGGISVGAIVDFLILAKSHSNRH